MLESIVFYYLIIWPPLGYILGALGMFLEGDLSWFTLAFLSSQGFFNLELMLLVVFVSVVLSDTFFFYLGRWIKYLPKFVFFWSDRISRPFDKHINNRPLQTLLISKFAYGIHKPILVRMGMIDKSYWDFIKVDLPSIFTWMAIIGSLGYFSGLSFFLVQRYLHYAEIGLLIGLVVFTLIIKILTNYSIKKL